VQVLVASAEGFQGQVPGPGGCQPGTVRGKTRGGLALGKLMMERNECQGRIQISLIS
jgi:hypothetical protein